jgi:hypothetical protein
MGLGSWPADSWVVARKKGVALRIVSLNCASVGGKAALEVEQFDPDIILLQESPSRLEIESVATKLFGADAGMIAGREASIIVRGNVSPVVLPASLESYFVQARVQLKSGLDMQVISLRLVEPYVRVDLWSPDCWKQQRMNRQKRHKQLQAIADQIRTVPPTTPVIVGGDFNAPSGDAIFRVLQPRLRDSFAEGGVGFGNTITNEFPFHRIDQIWISDHFEAAAVVARRTQNSDHRMVVCDLVIEFPSPTD